MPLGDGVSANFTWAGLIRPALACRASVKAARLSVSSRSLYCAMSSLVEPVKNAASHSENAGVLSGLTNETGEKELVERDKKVRRWYWRNGDKWFFQLRYGAKVLDLGKGRNAVEVDNEDALIEAIDVCSAAVKAGELDTKIYCGPNKFQSLSARNTNLGIPVCICETVNR